MRRRLGVASPKTIMSLRQYPEREEIGEVCRELKKGWVDRRDEAER